MTQTVRATVLGALRRLGAISSGDDPNAQEIADALTAYNNLVRPLHGTIIGTRLTPIAMTAAMTGEPGGLYQCALASGATLTLPANPKPGARIGVADAKLNFNTNNLTVNPNSRLIEGASTNLVLSAAGTTSNRIWWFNHEQGNWVKEADALIDDNVVYPDSLIGYLPDMLAVQIVSEYGGDIRQDIVARSAEGKQAFARVFGRRGRNQADAPVGTQIQETAR